MSHYLPFIFHLMKGKKITRKQDVVFPTIIWPNYSRLLSKLNKSDQNSCVSMCACAHEHMRDFVCVVHGRKELKPPDIEQFVLESATRAAPLPHAKGHT